MGSLEHFVPYKIFELLGRTNGSSARLGEQKEEMTGILPNLANTIRHHFMEKSTEISDLHLFLFLAK